MKVETPLINFLEKPWLQLNQGFRVLTSMRGWKYNA